MWTQGSSSNDAGREQSLGVGRRRGHGHLQPRARASASASRDWECWAPNWRPPPDRGADGDGHVGPPARHVAELGGVVGHLVHGHGEEVHEHDLGHRPHPRPARRRWPCPRWPARRWGCCAPGPGRTWWRGPWSPSSPRPWGPRCPPQAEHRRVRRHGQVERLVHRLGHGAVPGRPRPPAPRAWRQERPPRARSAGISCAAANTSSLELLRARGARRPAPPPWPAPPRSAASASTVVEGLLRDAPLAGEPPAVAGHRLGGLGPGQLPGVDVLGPGPEGVGTEAEGEALEERRARRPASARSHRLAGGLVHVGHAVAVDGDRRHAVAGEALGQRARCGCSRRTGCAPRTGCAGRRRAPAGSTAPPGCRPRGRRRCWWPRRRS